MIRFSIGSPCKFVSGHLHACIADDRVSFFAWHIRTLDFVQAVCQAPRSPQPRRTVEFLPQLGNNGASKAPVVLVPVDVASNELSGTY